MYFVTTLLLFIMLSTTLCMAETSNLSTIEIPIDVKGLNGSKISTHFHNYTEIIMTQKFTSTLKTTTINKYTEEEKYIQHFNRVIFPAVYKVSFYMVMILFFIGLITNIISGVVFAMSKMATSPVGMYSICLSVADSLFLISEAFFWANDTMNFAPTGKQSSRLNNAATYGMSHEYMTFSNL